MNEQRQSEGMMTRLAEWQTRVVTLRRRAATVGIAALALVVGYGVVFGHNGLTAYARKSEEEKTLVKQIEKLRLQNERQRVHVERLEKEPEELEHEARARLHYTRPGEVIVTLPAEPAR